MGQITWGEIAFPDDCGGELIFPEIPSYEDDCIPIPGKAQLCEVYFRPDGATDSHTYTTVDDVTTVTATSGGIDNSAGDNTKSIALPCIGSIAEPEEEILQGAKEVDLVVSRKYRTILQVAYQTIPEYLFLKHFQGNYRKFTFRVGDLDGWVFGGATGIRPTFVTAHFPKGEARDARKICNLILDFVTKDGDPPAHINPLA